MISFTQFELLSSTPVHLPMDAQCERVSPRTALVRHQPSGVLSLVPCWVFADGTDFRCRRWPRVLC